MTVSLKCDLIFKQARGLPGTGARLWKLTDPKLLLYHGEVAPHLLAAILLLQIEDMQQASRS